MIGEFDIPGYERVLLCKEPLVGYRSIIAIHSTLLGPAVGGTRVWNYQNDEEALKDALRLSRGMTYKNALAGLPFGGGKSVIIADNKTLDRQSIFRAHGRFIEALGGKYITAEDVGTSVRDMEYVSKETNYVAGTSIQGGDPSPWTARGVFRGIQASAKYRWGNEDLADRTVALQGCGSVGFKLAKLLHGAGAELIIADYDDERVSAVLEECRARRVDVAEILQVSADIFAPCALGGIINDQTIPHFKFELVAGAANNQLLDEKHGVELKQKGILYAPDYVINAGGVISGSVYLTDGDATQTVARVDEIYDTLMLIYEMAATADISTNVAANQLAEERLAWAAQVNQ